MCPPNTFLFHGAELTSPSERNKPNQPLLGHTELYTACNDENENNDERVKDLLAGGADPGERAGAMNGTALHIAAYHDRTGALKAMKKRVKPQRTTGSRLENGPQKRSRRQREKYNREKWQSLAATMDMSRQMPLHYAAEGGAVGAAQLLITAVGKLLIDAQDSNGCSPLHIAVVKGQAGVAKVLLDAGANPRLKNKKGKKPLEVAENDECRELIEEKIASKNRKGVGDEGKKKEVRPQV
jgi:ankyrin repeat protein